MKTLMQRTIWISIMMFIISFSLKAQPAMLEFRTVPKDKVGEFIEKETTYWSKVAQKAVDDGKLLQWALWRRVSGFDLEDDSYNFVFVNVFPEKAAMDDLSSTWNVSAGLPNVKAAQIETRSISDVVHRVVAYFEDGVGEGGNFVRVNFDKVHDWSAYDKRETEVWKPFITKAMEDKKTTCKGWSVASVVMPRGTSTPFNAFTADQYDTMSEAMSPTWADDIVFPESLSEGDPPMERIGVEVLSLVMRVSSN